MVKESSGRSSAFTSGAGQRRNQDMDRVKKFYLLPCSCSADIEVVAGQAGGRVVCPVCGRQNDVPKFRDLDTLRIGSSSAEKPAGRWGMLQAVALAGTACAALAWSGAAIVGSTPKQAFNAEAIRDDILRSDDDQRLYESLQEMATTTVSRMPMREEVDLQRRAIFATGMSRTLLIVGGLGAAAAVIAVAFKAASKAA